MLPVASAEQDDSPDAEHARVRRWEIEAVGRFNSMAAQEASRADSLGTASGLEASIPRARHAGLPVRAVDWTSLLGLAAYLATDERGCDGEDGCVRRTDGCIWWVDFGQFDSFAHERWPATQVPTVLERRAGLADQLRELPPEVLQALGLLRREPRIGDMHEASDVDWLCGLYSSAGMPRRMVLQQGFFTVSNRIRDAHDEILDRLDPILDGAVDAARPLTKVRRGRIVIPSSVKPQIRRWLRLLGVDAETFDLPVHDELARQGQAELAKKLRDLRG